VHCPCMPSWRAEGELLLTINKYEFLESSLMECTSCLVFRVLCEIATELSYKVQIKSIL
jgi:hypothetical protein